MSEELEDFASLKGIKLQKNPRILTFSLKQNNVPHNRWYALKSAFSKSTTCATAEVRKNLFVEDRSRRAQLRSQETVKKRGERKHNRQTSVSLNQGGSRRDLKKRVEVDDSTLTKKTPAKTRENLNKYLKLGHRKEHTLDYVLEKSNFEDIIRKTNRKMSFSNKSFSLAGVFSPSESKEVEESDTRNILVWTKNSVPVLNFYKFTDETSRLEFSAFMEPILKDILKFMGDKYTRENRHVIATRIVKAGVEGDEKVQDEIYLQLLKQSTDNESELGQVKGWFLIALCMIQFESPSFSEYVTTIVKRKAREVPEKFIDSVVIEIAKCALDPKNKSAFLSHKDSEHKYRAAVASLDLKLGMDMYLTKIKTENRAKGILNIRQYLAWLYTQDLKRRNRLLKAKNLHTKMTVMSAFVDSGRRQRERADLVAQEKYATMAAVKIQALVRGRIARRRLKLLREQEFAHELFDTKQDIEEAEEAIARGLQNITVIEKRIEKLGGKPGAALIQATSELEHAKEDVAYARTTLKDAREILKDLLAEKAERDAFGAAEVLRNTMAVRIQAIVRGHLARTKYRKLRARAQKKQAEAVAKAEKRAKLKQMKLKETEEKEFEAMDQDVKVHMRQASKAKLKASTGNENNKDTRSRAGSKKFAKSRKASSASKDVNFNNFANFHKSKKKELKPVPTKKKPAPPPEPESESSSSSDEATPVPPQEPSSSD